MSGNRLKIFAIVAFLGISLYYLFPTVKAYRQQQQLTAMTPEARQAYLDEHYEEVVDTRARALNLGLDLQGGMHVTIEVGVDALLRELAEGRTDEVFDSAIASARQEARTSRRGFVDLFVAAMEAEQPGTRLSRYFRNRDAGITVRSSNNEVRDYLQTQEQEALDRAVEIIRKRIDRFGVSEPLIQKQGSSRLSVELPGVDDPQRVRDLLRGTARLEFRLMAEPVALQASAERVFAYFAGQEAPADSAAEREDTTAAAGDSAAGTGTDSAASGGDSAASGVRDLAAPERPAATPAAAEGRDFTEMAQRGEGVIFAMVQERDTSAVRRMLAQPAVRGMIPPDLVLLYTARASAAASGSEEPVYYLLGVNSRTELGGDVLTDAAPNFDPYDNSPEVSLTMNAEGGQRWAQART